MGAFWLLPTLSDEGDWEGAALLTNEFVCFFSCYLLLLPGWAAAGPLEARISPGEGARRWPILAVSSLLYKEKAGAQELEPPGLRAAGAALLRDAVRGGCLSAGLGPAGGCRWR